VVEIVRDQAKSDPPFHATITSVYAPSKAVSPLQHTDAALAAGPPFLALLEPALLLLALPLGALVDRFGMHTRFTPLSCAAVSFLAE